MLTAFSQWKNFLGLRDNKSSVKTRKDKSQVKKTNTLKMLNPTPMKPSTIRDNLKKYGQLFFSIGSDGFKNTTTWLIKSLIPVNSFGVIYGPPSSLKSFLAIDICCHIATGISWGSHKVIKGAVVYIAAEGQSGASKRIKAWEIARGTEVNQLYVLGESVMLADNVNQIKLISAIQDIESKDKVKVNLIVIDTLARCYSGDENTTKDMTKFISGCDNVKSQINSTLLCIHHSGRDENRGGRGSSALLAACDFEFKIKRVTKAKNITMTNTKQKDADEAPTIEIGFESINLGIECEDNKPITSLARVDSITAKQDNTSVKSQNSAVLKILKEQFNGEATRVQLRQSLYSTEKSLSDAQRQKFSRELKGLEKLELIKIITSTSTNLDKVIALNLE